MAVYRGNDGGIIKVAGRDLINASSSGRRRHAQDATNRSCRYAAFLGNLSQRQAILVEWQNATAIDDERRPASFPPVLARSLNAADGPPREPDSFLTWKTATGGVISSGSCSGVFSCGAANGF
jgi:hypothetical protein